MSDVKENYAYENKAKDKYSIKKYDYLKYTDNKRQYEKLLKDYKEADKEFLRARRDAQNTFIILYRKKIEYERSNFFNFIFNFLTRDIDKNLTNKKG